MFKNPWGVRKLAYPINDQSKGHYVFYNFANTNDCVSELEKIMRIDEDVLRFLTVKISDKVDVEARKVELIKKEEEKQQEVKEKTRQ